MAGRECARLVRRIVYKASSKRAVMLIAGGPMATLTTHVLNIATGTPAAGMRVELRVLANGSAAAPSASQTNADGRCSAPLLEGAAFREGRYSLTFHVGAYFRSLGVELADPPFLDEIVIAF